MKTTTTKFLHNKTFKLIIVLLTLIILSSFVYIYKMSDRQKGIIVKLRSEKLAILTDLEKAKLNLDKLIGTKQNVSKELLTERAKVQKLLIQLRNIQNNSNNEETTIFTFQSQARLLQNRIFELTKEVEKYKRKADSTSIELIKSNKELILAKTEKDTLFTQNKTLTEKISKASKLTYFNLKTTTFKVRKSGKQIETKNASSIDLINVQFQVTENKLAFIENKKYFIQIFDFKNNLIGEKQEIKLGSQVLPFSAVVSTKYEKKLLTIDKNILVSKLEEGTYFINIFEKNNLILKSSFDLE